MAFIKSLALLTAQPPWYLITSSSVSSVVPLLKLLSAFSLDAILGFFTTQKWTKICIRTVLESGFLEHEATSKSYFSSISTLSGDEVRKFCSIFAARYCLALTFRVSLKAEKDLTVLERKEETLFSLFPVPMNSKTFSAIACNNCFTLDIAICADEKRESTAISPSLFTLSHDMCSSSRVSASLSLQNNRSLQNYQSR